MYLCQFNVLILSLSQLFIHSTAFEFKSCFFKLCGGAIESLRKLRDDIKCYLTVSKCKLDSKKQAFKDFYTQFFNGITGKVMGNVPKNIFQFDKIKNITKITRRILMPSDAERRRSRNFTLESFQKFFTAEIVNLNGFNAEVHNVITPDGYILTVHRLPPAMKRNKSTKNRTAILHHGLLGSSTDWVLLGPNNSLPYLLANEGYDVWLANARGNKYSKAHVNKSVRTSEFWDFSWHEIGLYDLSSIIDYVKEKTLGKSQIFFVAHSMGATALMVLLSTSPQYNKILNLVILLAPLVYMQQAKGPLRLLSEFQNLDYNATIKILGGDRFNPSESFINIRMRKFCRGDRRLCRNPLFLFSDGGKSISNSKHLANILTHVKAEGSVKTLTHYGQLINSGRFEMYDGGSTVNIKKYGTASPPKYHLKDVKLPVALFSSHDDWLSTIPDIIKLLSRLPNPVTHHIVEKTEQEFNHLDFVWSRDAPELVYKFIFDVMDQY